MSEFSRCREGLVKALSYLDSQETLITRLRADAVDFEQYRGIERALDALLAKLGASVRECAPDSTAYWQDQLSAIEEVLGKRLMPEGMEWPRFEDGEPVRHGDSFVDHAGIERKASAVTLYGDSSFDLVDVRSGRTAYDICERVKRPAPPAIKDTDGDSVHNVSSSVLNATGDSWERIDDDATFPPAMYCRAHGLELPPDPDQSDYDSAWAKDLLRRAQALMALSDSDVHKPGEVV